MSRSDLKLGRANQKLRTRRALLRAARELLELGEEATIDSVALRAEVSRATAYRYFSSTEKLRFEAGLDAVWDELELDESRLHPTDVVERVSQLHEVMWQNSRENERAFRMFLSSALKEWVDTDGKSDIRGGRRLPLIDIVLEPARSALPKSEYEKLRNVLAGMLGVDSLISMRDICKLDYEEAKETSRWAIRKLVESVVN